MWLSMCITDWLIMIDEALRTFGAFSFFLHSCFRISNAVTFQTQWHLVTWKTYSNSSASLWLSRFILSKSPKCLHLIIKSYFFYSEVLNSIMLWCNMLEQKIIHKCVCLKRIFGPVSLWSAFIFMANIYVTFGMTHNVLWLQNDIY